MRRYFWLALCMFATGLATTGIANATYERNWVELPIVEDPLVRMPGTQPMGVQGPFNDPDPEHTFQELNDPTMCYECHGLAFNKYSEPGFNWSGSLMAQAARDFLFWSAMAVAAQDSIWAINRPNAADICERCHLPKGWLEGRSDPANGSAFKGADFDGVQCDFCHRMFDPFFETTTAGTREGDDWEGYWDEAKDSWTGSYIELVEPPIDDPDAKWVPSPVIADYDHGAKATYEHDLELSQWIKTFYGNDFYRSGIPPFFWIGP